MSSSKHGNNKRRNILVLDKYFIQGIDNTTICAEKMYSPHLTVNNKTCCLSLHYNGDNSYLFVNGKEVINFKCKYSDPLCLGNISKDFDGVCMVSAGLARYVYDFIVDYWAIANDKILDIHNYLMKKNNIV